jgi:hypothetical protein
MTNFPKLLVWGLIAGALTYTWDSCKSKKFPLYSGNIENKFVSVYKDGLKGSDDYALKNIVLEANNSDSKIKINDSDGSGIIGDNEYDSYTISKGTNSAEFTSKYASINGSKFYSFDKNPVSQKYAEISSKKLDEATRLYQSYMKKIGKDLKGNLELIK